MIEKTGFLFSAAAEWQDLGDGVQRQILGYDAHLMLVKVKFEQGAVGQLHHHPHIQFTYIESGQFNVTIDGKTVLLKAGDGFLVPTNQVHGVVCIDKGMLVDVFNPLREDFLIPTKI